LSVVETTFSTSVGECVISPAVAIVLSKSPVRCGEWCVEKENGTRWGTKNQDARR
jgi:hypothetical protein